MTELDQNTINELIKNNKIFKQHKIESFNEGILHDSFNTPTGSPREIYNELLKKLTNIYTFLLHDKKKDKDETEIIDDIEKFLTDTKLPSINVETKDFSEKGRIITISREDDRKVSKCAVEDVKDQRDSYREDQYFKLNNNLCMLIAKATAFLQDEQFNWYTEKIMIDVEPENDYDANGELKNESNN